MKTSLGFVQNLHFYFFMRFWLLCMIGIWIGKRPVVVQSRKVRMRFIGYITVFLESTKLHFCFLVILAISQKVVFSHETRHLSEAPSFFSFRTISFFETHYTIRERIGTKDWILNYLCTVFLHTLIHLQSICAILPGLNQLAYSRLHVGHQPIFPIMKKQ